MIYKKVNGYEIKGISSDARHLGEIIKAGDVIIYRPTYPDAFVLKVEGRKYKTITTVDETGLVEKLEIHDPSRKGFKSITKITNKDKKYRKFGMVRTAEEFGRLVFENE